MKGKLVQIGDKVIVEYYDCCGRCIDGMDECTGSTKQIPLSLSDCEKSLKLGQEVEFEPPCECSPACRYPFANGVCKQRNQGCCKLIYPKKEEKVYTEAQVRKIAIDYKNKWHSAWNDDWNLSFTDFWKEQNKTL